MLSWLLLLSGAYPMWAAWRANRRTTLVQAVQWSMLAWAAWAAVLAVPPAASALPVRYVALCLTGCAGVAVLGARRPGVRAWNFVVVGLLAVLLLPLVEGLNHLSPPRLLFLGATLAVALLNYLPTRLAPAALVLAIGCAVEFLTLFAEGAVLDSLTEAMPASRGLLAATPWVALARSYRKRRPRSELDRIWLSFRDRYGLLWGQRLREQFNRSATHAGWPVQLGWHGWHAARTAERTLPTADEQKEMVATLQALLKRFGPEKESVGTSGSRPRG